MVAEGGRQVTFIEMLDEFMCNITFDERQVYELRFSDLDVSINTGQRLVEVTGDGHQDRGQDWARSPSSRSTPWCWPRASGPTGS